jgi:hypothetical protein
MKQRLFIDLKKANNSGEYGDILIEFGITMELFRRIKMCSNETYGKIRIGKHLSDAFPIQNGPKKGDTLSIRH